MTPNKAFKKSVQITLGLTACLAVGAAYAAVIVDEEGKGFVGKGDVQLVLNWNNEQLQAYASGVSFRLSQSETVSWTCYKDGDVDKQDQTRTRVTAIAGGIAYDSRKNKQNQTTGFNLNGFPDDNHDGDPDVTETTDGPRYHSCPNNWAVIGDDDVTSGDALLQVSENGSDPWYNLTITQ